MTGTRHGDGVYLQHAMAWPGARAGTLLRALAEAERRAWALEPVPSYLVLDVERDHPYEAQLRALAGRREFREFNADEASTWFVKYRRP